MQKRYIYILLSEDCEVLATETSLKKIVDKYGNEYGLLSYHYLAQKLGPAKREDKPVFFTGKDGNEYQLVAKRIQ